jgi:TubC N-terminal docking domain
MSAHLLLADLRARGINVLAEGDTLRVSAPRGALSEADRAALAECKTEVLSLLRRPTSEDVAAALAWAAWGFWPAIVGEGGVEVKGGRAAWQAFSERCTAGDLAEVRRVAGWPEGLPPEDDGEPAQLALLGVPA